MGWFSSLIDTLTFDLFDLDGSKDVKPPPDPLAAEEKARKEALDEQKKRQGFVDKFGRSSTFKTGSAGLVSDPNLKKNKLLGNN